MRCASLCVLAACGRIGFAPEAGTVDASTTCPASYSVSIMSSASLYRVIATDELPRIQYDVCASDAPGLTHLAAVDNPLELTELAAALQPFPAPSLDRFYIGLVQLEGTTTIDGDWRHITGAPVDAGVWHAGQPDDSNDVENAAEQLAVIQRPDEIHDVSGGFAYGAVCECDGLAIDATVEANLPWN